MRKPDTPIQEELKPHHVFQLQLIVYSMLSAKRWSTSTNSTPPIDCFGLAHSTLAWENTNDTIETRAIRDRWYESATAMIEILEHDRARSNDPGLWGAPIFHLERLQSHASSCGEAYFTKSNVSALPNSMFAKSSKNSFWIHSLICAELYRRSLLIWYIIGELYVGIEQTLWWDSFISITCSWKIATSINPL